MDNAPTKEGFTEVEKGTYIIGEHPLMTRDISSCVCIAITNPYDSTKGMAHILGEDFKNGRFKAGIDCLVDNYLAIIRKNIPCFRLCEAEAYVIGGDFNCNSELDEDVLVLLSYRNSGKADEYLKKRGAEARIVSGNKYALKDVFLASNGTLRVKERITGRLGEEEAAVTYDEVMMGLAGGLANRKERRELRRELSLR